MTRRLLLAALFPVALLAAATPALAQRSAPYQAIGTEPFWSVSIDARGRMRFEDPEGVRANVRTPTPRPSLNGRRYVTRRLTVDITRQECSDGMSDRTYEDTMRVVLDGRAFSGCGGNYTDLSRFAGLRWQIVGIDNARVSGDQYQMSFTADRVSGQAGCNRFNGSYRVDSRTLTAGPLATTRMACPGPRMQHETAVLRILGRPVRVVENGAAALTLSNALGTISLRLVP